MLIYDTIGDQITEMFGHLLASIKRKRNSLASIETLTDELLSLIFLFAVSGETAITKFQYSHVCARWRHLFLTDSRLWTDINLCDSRMRVEACLERAGSVLLELKYPWQFESPFNHELLEDVVETRAQQIRSITVNLPPAEVLDLGTVIVTTALPQARFVSLTVVQSGWGDEISVESVPVNNLFDSNAPNLRYLRLQKFGLPWSLSKFTKLTTIMLSQCSFMHPTANMDFITILSGLPTLKQLSLINCSNLCHYGSLNTRLVSLPELQVVQLDDLRLNDMVQLLSSIVTKPSMRLSGKVRFIDDDPITLFSQLNLSNIESLETIQDLSVEIGHINNVMLETVTLTGSNVKSGLNKKLMFSFAADGLPFAFQSFPAMCEPFNFTNLRKLSLAWRQCGWGTPIVQGVWIGQGLAEEHDAGEALMYFLRRSPDLAILSLSGCSSVDVLRMLSQREGSDAAPPCPKLQSLRFELSKLSDQGLKDLVRGRTGCLPLRSLSLITSYGFCSGTVAWLRDHVDDIFWDNETNELTIFDQ